MTYICWGFMGRKRLKPDYNQKKIMQELIDITKELYDRKLSASEVQALYKLGAN